MKKVKQLKGWGIYQNNRRETEEYGFAFTVIHPDDMEYAYMCSPSDSDVYGLDTLEQAVEWVENY